MKPFFPVLFAFFLLSCMPQQATENMQCATDADCVPAACCHPKDAVNKAFAPNCEGIACTLECAPETLDCGQGEVKCVDNECKAMLK